MGLSITLNDKCIIIIIILFILSFMFGYHLAKRRASKFFARFVMDLQQGNVRIKVVEADNKEELENLFDDKENETK